MALSTFDLAVSTSETRLVSAFVVFGGRCPGRYQASQISFDDASRVISLKKPTISTHYFGHLKRQAVLVSQENW